MGRPPVVIGTRSAVFAPLPDPGLIILDEEQEGSYQSESMVRYHAREVAKFRCTQHKGLLVLGSATPAIESRYAAETGQYHLFTLTQRYNAHPLPPGVSGGHAAGAPPGQRHGPVRQTAGGTGKNLARGEQTILFLNRRGNSRMALCSDPWGGPHLSPLLGPPDPITAPTVLMCHYCGYPHPLPPVCPQCGGRFQLGIGTQKLQEELQALYPDTEVMRMDADTVTATHPMRCCWTGFADLSLRRQLPGVGGPSSMTQVWAGGREVKPAGR